MEMTEEQNKEISELINECFANEDYKSAIDFLNQKIGDYPDDHWLFAQLGISYYELKEYDKALQFSSKAVELSPKCPLSLDYYAMILFANQHTEQALQIWNNLLNTEINELAYDQCGEGLNFTKSLINDIRFALGDVYVELNDKRKALSYYKSHLQNRHRGLYSNYTKKQVEKEINQIEKELLISE
jgi:tetratricopeptide (TPR) repeat protein